MDSLTILGVRVDRVGMAEAIDVVERFVEEGRPHRIVTVNLEYLRHARDRSDFREAIDAADLAVADGAPLVWASKLSGQPLPERVTGVDLADRCARLAAEKGYGLFLLGAGPGVAEATAESLQGRYPSLRIAGAYTPPMGEFSPEEGQRIQKAIQTAKPQILLIALPTPRQELWIYRNLGRWNVPLTIGVGAAFDMLSGRVSRAPRWMQRTGLEWLFRLIHEPGRLWKRYLIHDLPLMFRILASNVNATSRHSGGSGPEKETV